MSRTAHDPPEVQLWRRSSPKSSTTQYAALVRAFMAQRLSVNIDDATEDELVHYCVAQTTLGMQEKVARALGRFFEFHCSQRGIPNPALRLKERLKEEAANERLLDLLKRAGLTDRDARLMRWRDVARVGFGTEVQSDITGPLPGRHHDVMEHLVRQLLSQLRHVSPDDVDALLDRLLC